MKPPCAHIPTSDFKASPREWICSGCGKVGAWNDNWSYFGAIGCRKCGQEPVIDFVACSEACRVKHEAGKRVVSRSLVADSLRRVDEQIEGLQRQRNALAKKLGEASPVGGR
jgi:hypothetical protein